MVLCVCVSVCVCVCVCVCERFLHLLHWREENQLASVWIKMYNANGISWLKTGYGSKQVLNPST